MSNDMIPLDVTAPQGDKIKQLADDLFWFACSAAQADGANPFETAEGGCYLIAESMKSNAAMAIHSGAARNQPIAGIIVSHRIVIAALKLCGHLGAHHRCACLHGCQRI